VWPIGIGAPCIGCTEKAVAFKVPMFQVVQLHTIAAPPTSFAPITTTRGTINPLATGLVGLGVGVLATGGYVASRKFSRKQDDEDAPGRAGDSGKGPDA
jgi:hydrogenase small subunit